MSNAYEFTTAEVAPQLGLLAAFRMRPQPIAPSMIAVGSRLRKDSPHLREAIIGDETPIGILAVLAAIAQR